MTDFELDYIARWDFYPHDPPKCRQGHARFLIRFDWPASRLVGDMERGLIDIGRLPLEREDVSVRRYDAGFGQWIFDTDFNWKSSA